MYISRKNSQILAVLILVVFFVTSATYVSLASRSQEVSTLSVIDDSFDEPPAAKETPESTTQQELGFAMKDFHRSETKDGKLLWEITGTQADFAPQSKAVIIQDCKLHYISKDDTPIFLTSNQAKLHLEGTIIIRAEFMGNVVLVHDKETTIKTNKADYYKEKNELIAPGEVEILGPGYTITGKRLEGDLEIRKFELMKDVKSHIDPKKKRKEKGL